MTAPAHAGAAPGRWRAWWLAARPATLTAAVVPVVVGTACAATVGAFRAGPALAALCGAVLIQIGTNFANDVFDYEKGADTEARLGPTRAVAAGLIAPRSMRAGMIAAFALATGCGVYLVWVAGWPVVAIGVASILAGVAYTGGPYPLGYHGLGDLFVLVFFGFVAVCGTSYVQVLAVPDVAWWASVPVGCLATAILVVNNLRDRATDVRAGKRTLAVRLGRGGALAEYALLLGLAYATPLLLWAVGPSRWPVLLPLLTLPAAVRLVRRVWASEGRALNPMLAGTARLLVWFGLPFALGVALGG
ncbi:MAG: 1,4-dihydroxy-2-naphthoate polyprenyltransferase [Myxococcota bacterium]